MVMLQLNKDFEVGGHSGGPSGKLHPDSLRASEPHAKSGGLVSAVFCLTSSQMHEPFVNLNPPQNKFASGIWCFLCWQRVTPDAVDSSVLLANLVLR